MKKTLFYLFIVGGLLFSCDKGKVQEIGSASKKIEGVIKKKTVNISDLVLSSDVLVSTSNEINDIYNSGLTKKMSPEQVSKKMKDISLPFVENGKQIFAILLDSNELTVEDSKYLENINDEELAQLSIIMAILKNYTNNNTHSMTARPKNGMDPRMRNCISVALGIAGLIDLIDNTRKLMSTNTAVQILKIIGRRYLGWIGVAMMVHDFYDCYYGNGYWEE